MRDFGQQGRAQGHMVKVPRVPEAKGIEEGAVTAAGPVAVSKRAAELAAASTNISVGSTKWARGRHMSARHQTIGLLGVKM